MNPRQTLPPMAYSRAAPVRAGWRRYVKTRLVGAVLAAGLVYLVLVNQANPVPEPGQLVKLPIEVLSVQDEAPHLQVRLVDGTQRTMTFPVLFTLVSSRYDELEEAEQKKLPGCMGYVQGVGLRWVPDEGFRIWDLHCGPVHKAFDEFRAAYEARAAGWPALLGWYAGVVALITGGLFWLERRGLRRGGVR